MCDILMILVDFWLVDTADQNETDPDPKPCVN